MKYKNIKITTLYLEMATINLEENLKSDLEKINL